MIIVIIGYRFDMCIYFSFGDFILKFFKILGREYNIFVFFINVLIVNLKRI